jgi:hypothetical protein
MTVTENYRYCLANKVVFGKACDLQRRKKTYRIISVENKGYVHLVNAENKLGKILSSFILTSQNLEIELLNHLKSAEKSTNEEKKEIVEKKLMTEHQKVSKMTDKEACIYAARKSLGKKASREQIEDYIADVFGLNINLMT